MGAVNLHSFHTQMKLLSDLSSAQSLTEKLENFNLPVGQPVNLSTGDWNSVNEVKTPHPNAT
jgi:hypothetical protein